ncbi:MAG: hypothetical protein V3W34_11080 [Phycisphaerae bacterium]
MTIEQLREIHQARPFAPFRLQLADGNEVEVSHPETLAFHPKNPRSIAVALPNGAVKVIDLLLVTAAHIGYTKPRRKRRK